MVKLIDIQNVFCARPWHEIAMHATGEATVCQSQMRGKDKGPAACKEFVRFMDHLDKSRNQDWRSSLPDLAGFLKKYNIG